MKIKEELVGRSVRPKYFKIGHAEQDLTYQAELFDRLYGPLFYTAKTGCCTSICFRDMNITLLM